MRDRCPYCGLPFVTRRYVDRQTKEIVREIDDHPCPSWAPMPALSSEPSDTSFLREARNTAEGLRRWREQNR